MADTLICGIDIGSSKVATILAIKSKDSDDLRIIGFNATQSKGVKKGIIVDIDQATLSIESSVEKAERMAGHQIKEAYVTVGGPHISSLNSSGVVAVSNPQLEVVSEDVQRVIEAAKAISLANTRKVIDVSPREYSVDGQSGISNPIGMSGVRLEVNTHIITASTPNLKNTDKVLADLGIKNKGYVFAGVASSEAVLTDTEKDLGVAVIDIGGGKMDICIYIEGALSYSASIPVGARHISNDIAVGLRVSLDTAEKVKVYLSNKYQIEVLKKKEKIMLSSAKIGVTEQLPEVPEREIIDGIILPRLDEMFSLISEEIQKSGFAKSIPSGIVLTGGGALTVGMVEVGKKITRLPIRIGVPEKGTGLVDEVMSPLYSATLGLIYHDSSLYEKEDIGLKDFNAILKNFSINDIISNVRKLVKQFIP
jgi:cell division protein FtsA